MDIISAYQQLGSYRAAAAECDTTHRTVAKVVAKFEADQAGVPPPPRAERTWRVPVSESTRFWSRVWCGPDSVDAAGQRYWIAVDAFK